MSRELPVGKIIAHVDLDAFYAALEQVRDPLRLKGRPVAVVQYNPFGSLQTLDPTDDRLMKAIEAGGAPLIAVNYAARAAGVLRNMTGAAARKLCPDICLVQVPTKHGKADLTVYRDGGSAVLRVLGSAAGVKVERASIDECYLDLTEAAQRRLEECCGMLPLPPRRDQVHVCGAEDAAAWWGRPAEAWAPGERLLAAGAMIVAEQRLCVETELGYTCSAGIAHTRLLAKLCSGLHKPAQQTVLPAVAVPELLGTLPIVKLRGLGGKFGGRVAAELGITKVGELAATPLARLEALFGAKDAAWLESLACGVDDAGVEERRLPKSVSCGKTFRGATAIGDVAIAHTWLLELAGELEERLSVDKEENKREPRQLTVSVGAARGGGSVSRSCPLRRLDARAMADDAAALVRRWAGEQPTGWAITAMYLAASNFADLQGTSSIKSFFKAAAKEIFVDKESDRMVEKAENGGKMAAAGAAAGEVADRPDSAPAGVLGGASVDEATLAELPADIQREIRAAMRLEAAAGRGGGGGGATHGRGVKRREGPTLKDFFKGGPAKAPKR